ncbi:MFS transporter [Jiangella anatolica]|uniref:MFS transporter n=1 Tax=Jiangella anatolica TaxID=2670374 RepID=UPI001314F839|nr:MFS transporter [Jiangella anatolica]
MGVVWVIAGAAFVVLLSQTMTMVALPSIMADLEIGAATAQWLTSGFMLGLAVMTPIAGFLLRRLRTTVVFAAAMATFVLGTVLAGLAPGFELLLVARVVQASGGAVLWPMLMTVMIIVVPVIQRGRMLGTVSAVLAIAPVLGPTVAGLMLDRLTWRWTFWAILPIALVIVVVGLRGGRDVLQPRPVRLDALSVLLSTAGFGGLVYGLTSAGPDDGAGSGSGYAAWVCLGIGVAALGGFVVRQLRLHGRDRALLDLRTFRYGAFTVSMALLVVGSALLFGVIMMLQLYLQLALELDPGDAGLLQVPGAVAGGLTAPVVGRLYDRFGPRVVAVPGSVLVSLSLWGMTLLTEASHPAAAVAVHVVLYVGLTTLFMPIITTALHAVHPALQPDASVAVNTFDKVAAAAGTAVFVAVYAAWSGPGLGGGAVSPAAAADGVHAAAMLAAVVSLLIVAGSFFVQRPD